MRNKLELPKYFVILSKWKCDNILRISFFFLVCLQYQLTLSFKIISVTLQISFYIVMLTNFYYFIIRLLFPASNSVSLLICRVTVFRFKICVNKLNFCFFIIWLLMRAWGLLRENQKWNFSRKSFSFPFPSFVVDWNQVVCEMFLNKKSLGLPVKKKHFMRELPFYLTKHYVLLFQVILNVWKFNQYSKLEDS